MTYWDPWARCGDVATRGLGDDVARDALAKRRGEGTKTASWSEERRNQSQSKQMRQAEGAGEEWGLGEARERIDKRNLES